MKQTGRAACRIRSPAGLFFVRCSRQQIKRVVIHQDLASKLPAATKTLYYKKESGERYLWKKTKNKEEFPYFVYCGFYHNTGRSMLFKKNKKRRRSAVFVCFCRSASRWDSADSVG